VAVPAAARCAKELPSPTDRQVEAWLSAMDSRREDSRWLPAPGLKRSAFLGLHIPALRMTDGPVGVRAGQATAFPAGTLLAATFDPALSNAWAQIGAKRPRGTART